VLKLDPSGNFSWVKNVSGNNCNVAQSLNVDPLGNVYIAGYFNGTADFDPGIGVMNLNSSGSSDIFISKLNTLGNLMWAKSIGGPSDERAIFINTDNSGNSYSTGFFDGIVDFDPGTGTSNLTSNGDADAFVLKLDPSGNLLLAKNIGGTGFDGGTALSKDASGNIILVGIYEGTIDADPNAGVLNLTSAGSDDTFILKWNATVGIKENVILKNIRLFPNPVKDILNVDLDAEDLLKPDEFEISNTLGQIVMNEKLGNFQIDLRNLEKGMYLLKLMSENKVIAVQKIIKE
jgi:hypothetical protein